MSAVPLQNESRFWRRAILWGLFISFLVLFFSDLKPAWEGWRDLVLILFRRKLPPLDPSLFPSMLRIAMNITVYGVVFVISTFIVAQFALPVENWKDRLKAFDRLLDYAIPLLRGPAVFVRNGRLVSRIGEEDNINPGVVVVDLRSAVVVEQAYPYLGEADDFPDRPVLEEEPVLDRSQGLLRTLRRFRREKEYPVARVLGPGIHFTVYGEKIRTAIDLRRQVRFARSKPVVAPDGKEYTEPGVKGFTRDGIEVGTNCSVVFSISDAPEVIPVAYWGGKEARHLHGLQWEKDGDIVKIKDIHALDSADAEEIHQAVASARITASSTTPWAPELTGLYPLDKSRVFNAAYGQVSGISMNDKAQWHELPLSIAMDIYRNLLEKYDFDYLYSVDDPNHLPWKDEFRPEFTRHVKYQGVLSYHLVRPVGLPPLQNNDWNIPLDGTPLTIKVGDKINFDALEFSVSYSLTNPKSLRDRGIKVIAAGFSELKMPANIRDNLIERWKARWEREIQVALARQAREAMQIISSARNRAQRDNAYFLSNLFKEERHSKEALALLIFQSLELAATDVKNQKELPPKEILSMLQNLHSWLLKERQEMEGRKRHDNGNDDSEAKGNGVSSK